MREGGIASVEKALQVHLAKFSCNEDADMFVKGEFLGIGRKDGWRLPTFLGWEGIGTS